ncbi:hypothetical protein WJX73_000855 [Symbiochloris irregularis]|uniref:Uncharacterized protein n=1 Tax=Symbiochloris irregularis TaxID=706552 RepID=A0AAW1NNZ3_9CHLO
MGTVTQAALAGSRGLASTSLPSKDSSQEAEPLVLGCISERGVVSVSGSCTTMPRRGAAGVSEHVLHQAVEAGDLQEVDMLLHAGFSPDAAVRGRPTPLISALTHGHASIARSLLAHGADPHQTDEHGSNLLHIAATLSQMSAAPCLLEDIIAIEGATAVRAKDAKSRTPLMLAIESNNKHAIDALLQHTPARNTSDADVDGHTALHLAVACCSSKTVEKLLMLGWDVNALDYLGQSPLHVSAIRGVKATMQVLLRAGADVFAKDLAGMTPCELAAAEGNHKVQELLTHAAEELMSQHESSPSIMLSAENALLDRFDFSPQIIRHEDDSPKAQPLQRTVTNGADSLMTHGSESAEQEAHLQALHERLQDLQGVEQQVEQLRTQLRMESDERDSEITALQLERDHLLAANAALNQEASTNETKLQTMASKLQAATSRQERSVAQLQRNEEEAAAQLQEQVEAENEKLHRLLEEAQEKARREAAEHVQQMTQLQYTVQSLTSHAKVLDAIEAERQAADPLK